jgi:hypothetical protein
MRKLRLTLETLRIESFTTGLNSLQRGTVQGQSALTTLTKDATYRISQCDNPTAEYTCDVSCGYGVCPQTPNTACEM